MAYIVREKSKVEYIKGSEFLEALVENHLAHEDGVEAVAFGIVWSMLTEPQKQELLKVARRNSTQA